MGTTLSVIKTLLIPALISLVLFLALTYLLLPLWRHYRNRYSQYLPLDTISTQTTSLRIRMQDAIARWISSSSRWRLRGRDRVAVAGDDESDIGFSSEEGEELNEVDEDRRHALSLDTHHQHTDSSRRLSRDLEEGFRDDSDDDDDRDRRSRR
ncbi:putative electron transport complex subunit C [Rosellinia necatrix]|uniref:Putative electron transport complex subunit C n=1 Tax=Rosellinia necatrix TaxID=77044 RepID=A0A1W2THI7_ROSNE|nr:putative electron transport complex subunit C [Rosellinia necatrix]